MPGRTSDARISIHAPPGMKPLPQRTSRAGSVSSPFRSHFSVMSSLFLFDVAPDPVPVAGVRSLVVLVVVVLFLGTALVGGFVFLLKRIKRRRANPPGTTAQSSVINSPE